MMSNSFLKILWVSDAQVLGIIGPELISIAFMGFALSWESPRLASIPHTADGDFELLILRLLSPKCWDHRPEAPSLVYVVPRIKHRSSWMLGARTLNWPTSQPVFPNFWIEVKFHRTNELFHHHVPCGRNSIPDPCLRLSIMLLFPQPSECSWELHKMAPGPVPT